MEGQNSQVILPDKVNDDVEKKLSALEVSELRLEDQRSNLVQSLIQHFTKPAKGGMARIPPTNVVSAYPHHASTSHGGTRHTQPLGRGQTSTYLTSEQSSSHSSHQHPAFADERQQERLPLQQHPRGSYRGPRGAPRARGHMGQRALR
ncbi:hypothetical protein SK128_016466, partial [Halocaridina rubra]